MTHHPTDTIPQAAIEAAARKVYETSAWRQGVSCVGWDNESEDYKNQWRADCESTLRAALTFLPSPSTDAEPVAHAYVVDGDCEQIGWGTDDLLDDPSLVLLYTSPPHSQTYQQGIEDAAKKIDLLTSEYLGAGETAIAEALDNAGYCIRILTETGHE